MTTGFIVLASTAAVIGLVHTVLGPDHYIPFVAMARAGRWSTRKALIITVICGCGHVAGSVVLALAGIALGSAFLDVEQLESYRASLAAWLMIAFGFAYMIYGIRQAYRNKPHVHWHTHEDGTMHNHEHVHHNSHLHVHKASQKPNAHDGSSPRDSAKQQATQSMTPWVLFVIFLFGPCEPLIPLIMYPAASRDWLSVTVVTLVFALVTIVTMTSIVWLGIQKAQSRRLAKWERFSSALAGLAILACGFAMAIGF